MPNNGKYIDRNPDLQAAGKIFKSVENIGDSLRNYSVEEAALNIVNLKCKKLHKNGQEAEVLRYSQFLPEESVEDLLSPESKKSRFIAFKEKFSENMYFKKAELGKALPLQSKPPEFTNENFIYGIKHETKEKLYDLVFPQKTTEEVENDFMKWHDKYLFSHHHYLPGEMIQRTYNDHFKPHEVYGISTSADKNGLKVKNCLKLCDRMVVINKAQEKFLDHKIGKPKIDRCNLNLPTNRTFGIQSMNQNNYTVKALIENVEPCAKSNERTEALSHIANLRRLLFNRSDFHMNDLRAVLKISDKSGSGYLKFNVIMKLLRSLQIRVNEQKVRTAILHFRMFKDGNETSELVSADEFWKMLHIQYPLPGKLISAQFKQFCTKSPTTYRLLCSDRDKPIPATQIFPRSSLESDPITAGDLIAPDVSMRYGLNPDDFQVLRPKEEMSVIFKHLLPHNFDQVWQYACTKKECGFSCTMSVREFKNFFTEYDHQL